MAEMKILDPFANQILRYYKHMGTMNQTANCWRYESMALGVSTK